MAESIKFGQGVSRLEGTPLSAPWDLRNAYIKPSHIVEALRGPSTESGIVAQDSGEQIFQHSGTWVEAQDAERFRSILYAASRDPDITEVYPQDRKEAENDLPRVSAIESQPTTDALYEDRIIVYVMIPINSRGEAGIWRYKAWNTGSDKALPTFSVEASSQTQYLEVYRTAEIPEQSERPERPVQSIHYLGRYSSSTGGVGQVAQYYSSVPHTNASEAADTYHEKDSVDYIYPAGKKTFQGYASIDNRDDVDLIGKDLTGWTVEFNNLHKSGTLSEGTEYEVTGNDDYSFTLGNTGGFDPEQILRFTPFEPYDPEKYTGVSFVLVAPDPSQSTGSSIVITDTEQWAYDLDEDEDGTQPESRIIERDRSLHGRTKITTPANVNTSPDPDEFTITGADYERFFTPGKVFSFIPDTSLIVDNTATGEKKVGGDLTLNVTELAFQVTLLSVTNLDSIYASYEIDGGSPNYTVKLERASAGTTDFLQVNTETETAEGQHSISEVDPPSSGKYDYRVKVEDSNSDVVTSDTETVDLGDDDLPFF